MANTLTIYRKEGSQWMAVTHINDEKQVLESFACNMMAKYIDKRPSITRTAYEFIYEDDSRIITFYFWNGSKYVYHIGRGY